MLTSIMEMRPASLGRLGALLAAVAGVLLSTSLAAQDAPGCPVPDAAGIVAPAAADTSRPATAPDTGASDIVLFAAVGARTVRFNSQPRVSVRFCWGNGAGDTLRVVERRNLPSPVVPGVTYRDVYVAAELRANLNAVCLLRELGLTVARDTTSGEVQREVQRRSGVC